jgi:hypothetical protein
MRPEPVRIDDGTEEAFLEFLSRAMVAHPELITPFTQTDVDGLDELLEGVETTVDEDLGDFELP